MHSDPELLSFAAEVLEKFGGVAEPHENSLTALLPSPLAQSLDLPEEVKLGEDGVPLLYGSPVLDRLIHLTTHRIPMVFGRIEVFYLKKAGFEQLIGHDLIFVNAQVRVTGRADSRTTYMVLTCRYVALSDERKEGLVHVGVRENTGAVIEDFENLWAEFKPEFYKPGTVPPHFPIHLEGAIKNGLRKAREAAREELTDFINSMRRRLQRDVENTREYYDALKKEMEASLSHPNLSEAQKQERMSKMQELPREITRKIEDLEHKYKIHVRLEGGAILRLLVDATQVMIEIRHRKLTRRLHIFWNPTTQRLDPLVCERCGESMRRVYSCEDNSQLRLCCFSCTKDR